MIKTSKDYKWFWAYEDQNITYIFDKIDDARDYATAHGMFDDICGKDAYVEADENLFFELSDDEIKDCEPYIFVTKNPLKEQYDEL